MGKKGLFIVFEGIDGAGKTTQAKLLVERLKENSIDAIYLKEPTEGEWGKKIRKIAVEGRGNVTPEEELNYFIKDREEDAKNNIVPLLAKGGVIIMDRYIYSNMAYQGALGFDPAAIWEKNERFPRPDAVFYLDITPQMGLKRISGREGGANIGFEKADYLEKVYEIFGSKEFEAMEKVDASKTIEEIREIVWSKVSPLLG